MQPTLSATSIAAAGCSGARSGIPHEDLSTHCEEALASAMCCARVRFALMSHIRRIEMNSVPVCPCKLETAAFATFRHFLLESEFDEFAFFKALALPLEKQWNSRLHQQCRLRFKPFT